MNKILQTKLLLLKTKHNRSGHRRQTFRMRTISVTNVYQNMGYEQKITSSVIQKLTADIHS